MILIPALLIHAAKIDENYTGVEKKIITKAIMDLNKFDFNKAEQVLKNAEKKEEESNQILGFTKDIKNMDEKDKEKIVEALWSVVYSDGSSDMYEENLMRRLSGLLYLDKKVVGNIKEKIKNKINK